MQRKTLLSKKLRELKVSGILITDPANLRYLSGFTGSSGFIIITEKESLFVTDFRYEEQARIEVRGFELIIERGRRDLEIKQLCDLHGIKKLGFEENNVTFALYKQLNRRGIRLKPLAGIVESFRIVKSELELESIRKAVKRAERAFRRLRPFIRKGVSEITLALRLEALLKEEGSRNLPFGIIVASGPMSALPHAQPTNRKLRSGDLVIFDWGAECEGYYSDMTRTFLMKGADTARQKKLYAIVKEAQERALQSIRPGISASVVDRAARAFIKDQGYGENFGHGTGHGVGLAVHEKPVVSWRSKEIIKNRMVFTVEPGIYMPGHGGVRIEDMVVVKGRTPEILTSLTKNLTVIER